MYTASTPLDDLTLAFLDVETTGLSPQSGDRVCEIAILQTRREQVQETFTSLVNPERPISPGAAAVNGLTDADVRDAPRFCQLADVVLNLLGNTVLVCHNAPFDLSFCSSEMQRSGRGFFAPLVVDTLQVARRCYSFPSNSLPHIAEWLGIPTPNAHRALGDATTTREVYLRFLADLQQLGVRTLGDVFQAQGGSVVYPPGQVPLPPTISKALSSGKRLFLTYVDAQGGVTERWVTPREVISVGGSVSLVAFCHLRKEQRQFRLDRIVEMRLEQ